MEPQKTLRQHCEEIALSLKGNGFSNSIKSLGSDEGFSFDPISIVMALLPVLAQCFGQKHAGQSPKDFLEASHDEVEGYDQSLIDDTRRETKRAAMQEMGRKQARRLTRGQLDSITVASFDHIRSQTEEAVALTCQECRFLPRSTRAIVD